MHAKRRMATYLILFTVLLLMVYALYLLRGKIGKIIFPFVLAIVVSYILYPVVAKLEAKKIARSVSIILIYLVLGVAFAISTVFVVPQLISNTKELINKLPEITLEYRSNMDGMVKLIHASKWPEDIKNAIYTELSRGTDMAENMILDALRNSLAGFIKIAAAMFDLVLAMVIAFYFLKDSEYFSRSALSLVPRKWRNGLVATFREINVILSSFVQGQLLTAVIVGFLETVALLLVGVKYPLILGMIGGVANTIPYFGPIIGAIPAVAVALIESPAKAVWTIAAYVVIQQIDNAFISPKIIESRLGLHPVTTILAVLAGGEFFGITGMLLAVPAAAVMKVIIKRTIEAIV